MIHRNATRLLNLVNQILDFRKIDQNKEKLTLSHIDIVSFVDNICTSFRTLANSKVTLAFDSTVPSLQMSFDADKVGKIVNNLLSNAYKFTPDGGFITVSLSIALRPACRRQGFGYAPHLMYLIPARASAIRRRNMCSSVSIRLMVLKCSHRVVAE